MLTDRAVRSSKPQEKPYKLSDGGGLHIVVQPNGSKLWRLKYRFAGKEKLLSFGAYPTVSLASARQKREDAKRQLASRLDPSVKKKLDKIAEEKAAQNTFGAVAAEHLANMAANGLAETTLIKNRWMLEDLAAPLARRPIAEIMPIEVLDVLKRIEKSGRRETARKLRGMIGSVFRYAVVTLRATNDPTAPLRGALLTPKVQHRPAIIDERELGILMRAIDEYDGWPTLRAALQLIALTMTRPGDVRFMRRSEINFERAVWRIPAERMKMRRPHDVPLSRPRDTPGDLGPVGLWRPRPAFDPVDQKAAVRERYELRSSAHGIYQGRDDLPRLPRHGQHHPQRAWLQSRRDRGGPCTSRQE